MPLSIQDYLTGLAESFRLGDFTKAVDSLATPATIAIAGQSLYVHDIQHAIMMLNMYRDNLRVEGYARTLLTIHHEEQRHDGQVRVLLTWTQVNQSDGVISTLDVSYLLEPADTAEGWRIILIEMISTPKPRLAAGIPIH